MLKWQQNAKIPEMYATCEAIVKMPRDPTDFEYDNRTLTGDETYKAAQTIPTTSNCKIHSLTRQDLETLDMLMQSIASWYNNMVNSNGRYSSFLWFSMLLAPLHGIYATKEYSPAPLITEINY